VVRSMQRHDLRRRWRRWRRCGMQSRQHA
jgi:hypothetical protein